jgi:hypothetical protein
MFVIKDSSLYGSYIWKYLAAGIIHVSCAKTHKKNAIPATGSISNHRYSIAL